MAKFDGVKLYDVLVSYGVTNPLKCYSVDSGAVTEAVNARAAEKGLDVETFAAEFLKDCEAAGAVSEIGTDTQEEETVEDAPEADEAEEVDAEADAESDAADESEDAPE